MTVRVDTSDTVTAGSMAPVVVREASLPNTELPLLVDSTPERVDVEADPLNSSVKFSPWMSGASSVVLVASALVVVVAGGWPVVRVEMVSVAMKMLLGTLSVVLEAR